MKWFKWLGLCCVLSIIALYLGLNYVVNGARVSKYLSDELGEDIKFESIYVSFFPRPALKLINVKYTGKEEYEIKFDKIYVGFSLDNTYSLDKVKIKYLSLIKPYIIFNKNEKKSATTTYSQINVPDLYIHGIDYENSILNVKKLTVKEFKGIKNIKIQGRVDFGKKTPYYNLTINVAKSDIKKIARNFNVKLPDFKNKGALKTLSFSLKIDGDREKLFLKDASISVDDTFINMQTSVKNFNLSTMESNLHIRQIDLNKYAIKDDKKNNGTEDYFGFLKDVTHSSKLTVGKLKIKNTDISKISLNLTIKNKLINVNPLNFELYGGYFQAIVKIDISRKTPKFKVIQNSSNVDIAELLTENEGMLKGKVNLATDVTFSGTTKKDILRSLRGKVKISGENLILAKYDIDEIISQYENTQNIGLLDITAVYLLGPFAGLVTHSAKFAVLKSEVDNNSKSKIEKFYSLWDVKYSIARAKDVALKTQKNIIVLKGAIDLQSKDLINIELAVLDKQRCAEYKKELVGNLETIDITARESALVTFMSLVFTILSETKGLFVRKCEPYYDGKVTW
jgi:hypothetical protein